MVQFWADASSHQDSSIADVEANRAAKREAQPPSVNMRAASSEASSSLIQNKST